MALQASCAQIKMVKERIEKMTGMRILVKSGKEAMTL